MTPNADNLRAQLVPEMLATDLADYLVRKVCCGLTEADASGFGLALVAGQGSGANPCIKYIRGGIEKSGLGDEDGVFLVSPFR